MKLENLNKRASDEEMRYLLAAQHAVQETAQIVIAGEEFSRGFISGAFNGSTWGHLFGPFCVSCNDVANAYNEVQSLFYDLMGEHGVGFFNELTADEC